MRGKNVNRLFFCLILLLFGYFMVQLFAIRFASGDIYPAYSTLRADPLGTRALFESLSALPELDVQRSYTPPGRFTILNNSCLFFLGVPGDTRHYVSRKEYRKIRQMLDLGGRLIVALTPVKTKASGSGNTETGEKKSDPQTADPVEKKRADSEKGGDGQKKDKPRENQDCCIDLFKALGVSVKYGDSGRSQAVADRHGENASASGTGRMDWPYALYFETGKDWQVRYSCSGRPVIIEKQFGAGSMVMLASSYIFSNESLKKDRNSTVLSSLVKDRTHVVFDEYHLGIQEQRGISILMRKYRLYEPVIVLVLLFILFVWKNSTSIIPKDDHHAEGLEPAGEKRQSPPSGMVGLLRRHIHKKELIQVCEKAWKAAFIKKNRTSKKYRRLLEQMESVTASASGTKSTPVETYNRICSIMSQGKKHDY